MSKFIVSCFACISLWVVVPVFGSALVRASMTLAQAAPAQKEIADRLNQEGLQAISTSQYPVALEKLQKALGIYRQIGDRSGEGTTLNNIGLVYSNLGQYPKALETYQQALAIRKEIGDRAVEGETLNNLGGV